MRHEVREPLALPRPVALLLFPTCADVHGVKAKPRGVPRLREEIADGTYRRRGACDLDPEAGLIEPKFSPSPRAR